ncbi:hypothetical protein F2Q70_00021402 [Brassica cretica]|uniref:Uncharacterized protein n=1 Tax=Brassica cretica TaxID=69181 RepID=A0A8S9GNK8_BRACR|nr:hypothetical protein F2Q70_00021402 [Brassica cretica]
MVYVVDRHSQRKKCQIRLIALALVLLQIADLYSLVSSSKLMSEMDFELPSSGVHQDLVNVLGMVLAVVDHCSSDVVDRRSLVVVDRFYLVAADRRHPI